MRRMNIGFPNEPGFRYGNFFNPRDEEISIPETNGLIRKTYSCLNLYMRTQDFNEFSSFVLTSVS